jgi:hypothetical protein
MRARLPDAHAEPIGPGFELFIEKSMETAGARPHAATVDAVVPTTTAAVEVVLAVNP